MMNAFFLMGSHAVKLKSDGRRRNTLFERLIIAEKKIYCTPQKRLIIEK